MEYDLQRFLHAQKTTYPDALAEIKRGKKESHWMWFIFPQLEGLGTTATSKLYALKNLDEATAYLQHVLLGHRLIEICDALLEGSGNDAHAIFGSPDDRKLRSCLTLFSLVPGAPPVFQSLLEKYFHGKKDEKTIQLLAQKQN